MLTFLTLRSFLNKYSSRVLVQEFSQYTVTNSQFATVVQKQISLLNQIYRNQKENIFAHFSDLYLTFGDKRIL